jgi:hypothetical protein
MIVTPSEATLTLAIALHNPSPRIAQGNRVKECVTNG